jgi:hypothetical protein
MKNQDLSHEIWLHYGDSMQLEPIKTREPVTPQWCIDFVWVGFEEAHRILDSSLYCIFSSILVNTVDWEYIAKQVNLCLED